MWFIIDDQMADERRIKRLPLATVGLWVKLCVIHSKGVSMQAKDPTAFPGHFDKIDLKDAGGTMKQLQQLIDMGLMEAHDDGWRPVYAEGICRESRVLTEEQREARRKAGSKGGKRKAANQKAKQTSGNLLANSQADGEQNSSGNGSETSGNLLDESQAKTWHKTDTYTDTETDIPSPAPPAGTAKQTGGDTPDHFAAIAGTYPGTIGAKGRKTETEARALCEAIAEDPVQLARLQAAVRRYKRAVNDGRVPQRQVPRLATWLRDQWQTWAPEPATSQPRHNHTWNCNHVHQLMDPHEDEYDHTGSLREGHPSEWWQACQACADELNNRQETSKEKQ